MRSTGIVNDPLEEKLDAYFRQCSIRVTAKDLAVMGATLAISAARYFVEISISLVYTRYIVCRLWLIKSFLKKIKLSEGLL